MITERSYSLPSSQLPTPFLSLQTDTTNTFIDHQTPLQPSKSEDLPRKAAKHSKRHSLEKSGPFFGSKSEQGFRMYQEDRYVEKPSLYSTNKCICAPKQRIPDGLQKYGGLVGDPVECLDGVELGGPKGNSFHYFAVFDGHGGDETSKFCEEHMHKILEDNLLSNLNSVYSIDSVELGKELSQDYTHELETVLQNSDDFDAEEKQRIAQSQFQNQDQEQGEGQGQGQEEVNCKGEDDQVKVQGNCRQWVKSLSNKTSSSESDTGGHVDCHDGIERSLHETFVQTDALFQKHGSENQEVIGSTALVMLLSPNTIYVANVGDSRAVLCRHGEALPLSDDHKADRLDEVQRVKNLGGHILHWNGVRVMGVLAMSRAIGDAQLKPYIIPEPEVTVVHRKKSDQLVIMASDGLWDVFDNQEACVLALRCLYRAKQRGATRRSATRIAAAILAKAAIDRGSRDNVTVLVVDLKAKDLDFTKEEVQDAVRKYKEKKELELEDSNLAQTDDVEMDEVKHSTQEDAIEKIPPSPFVTPVVQMVANE